MDNLLPFAAAKTLDKPSMDNEQKRMLMLKSKSNGSFTFSKKQSLDISCFKNDNKQSPMAKKKSSFFKQQQLSRRGSNYNNSQGSNEEQKISSGQSQSGSEQEKNQNLLMQNRPAYIKYIFDDFDFHKKFEDQALHIINDLSREKVTAPANAQDFHSLYKRSPNQKQKSKTLFIDLTDTLVSVDLYKSERYQQEEIEHTDPFTGKTMKLYISFRPGIREFFLDLYKDFEIIIFNNDSESFTKVIFSKLKELFELKTEKIEEFGINQLQPMSTLLKQQPSITLSISIAPLDENEHLEQEKQDLKIEDVVSLVLSKEQCSFNQSNHEIKEIELFVDGESGRVIEHCLIIDNNLLCFQKNLSNGIIVPKFEGDPSDLTLKKLSQYLLKSFIKSAADVKPTISKDFGIDKLIDQSRASVIKKMMNQHEQLNTLEKFIEETHKMNQEDQELKKSASEGESSDFDSS